MSLSRILPAAVIAICAPAANASSVSPQSQTACMTMQGNGPRFLALLGQAVAMLESDVHPIVSEGGSSAALVVPLIQATLSNRSLQETEILSPDGTNLSTAQKASLVLSSSAGPGETILFLPSLNRMGETVRDAAAYTIARDLGRAFLSTPNQHVANIEMVAGQGTLLVDFFATSNLGPALRARTPAERNAIIMEMWKNFAGMMPVTPSEFIRALVTAPTSPLWTPRGEEIKRRYFALFRTENQPPESTPERDLEQWNSLLVPIARGIDALPDGLLTDVYLKTLAAFRDFPFIGYVSVMAARPFLLPSPERIWNAYKGQSQAGGTLFSPPGTLIHTTARLADSDGRGGFKERQGLEHFYQTYMPSADLHDSLEKARQQAGSQGFVGYPEATQGWMSVVPPTNTVLLGTRSLAAAVLPSIAEPGAFPRFPIPLSQEEREANGLPTDGKVALMTYGGWMAHLDTPTLARLPQCQNADFIVDVSTLSQGLRDFQEYAIRPVIQGAWDIVWGSVHGRPNPDPVQDWLDRLWKSFEYGRSLKGRSGHIELSFDWDNASGLEGEEAKRMNRIYDENISAFFLRSYQDAVGRLASVPELRNPQGIPEQRTRLMSIDLRKARSAEELRAMVENLLD